MTALGEANGHISLSEQGYAGTGGCSGRRAHSPDTNSWRITPSVCSDLISDRDRGARGSASLERWIAYASRTKVGSKHL